MRLTLVSDAWQPQVNGVVTTLTRTVAMLRQRGHEVDTVTPDQFATVPCPTYPEIRLAKWPGREIARRLATHRPEAIHICTEGPLGLAARRLCRRRRLPFTTSLHTRFPEYVNLRLHTPLWLGYGYLRWFHNGAARTMVSTPHLADELRRRGLRQLALWSRGVDTQLFRPEPRADLPWPRPLAVYLGRVAVEKNLTAFLRLSLPGTKVVIGDGPALAALREKFPRVQFTGLLRGPDLAATLAAGDVFVFPSLTDTFGLVMLEAMACGLPVAAFPVRGPLDVVRQGVTGVLDHDLAQAIHGALKLDRARCREYAGEFSWERCTAQFEQNLAPIASPA